MEYQYKYMSEAMKLQEDLKTEENKLRKGASYSELKPEVAQERIKADLNKFYAQAKLKIDGMKKAVEYDLNEVRTDVKKVKYPLTSINLKDGFSQVHAGIEYLNKTRSKREVIETISGYLDLGYTDFVSSVVDGMLRTESKNTEHSEMKSSIKGIYESKFPQLSEMNKKQNEIEKAVNVITTLEKTAQGGMSFAPQNWREWNDNVQKLQAG